MNTRHLQHSDHLATPAPRAGRPPRRTTAIALALAAGTAATLAACGGDGERSTPTTLVDGKPVVAVTYSVLGDVVSQLVGDAATVRVVVPNGQDPHDYAPSAQDVELLRAAALVVSNGLALEEGMDDALHEVEDDSIPLFVVTDHIELRELGEDTGGGHGDDGHGHGSEDPHVWTDPIALRDMAPALAAALEAELGTDLDDRLAALQSDLTDLDAEVRGIMASIPAGECRLVTGHESLGYFADRYGCDLVGAVIPSLSSTAEASAKDLAALAELASETDVRAVFTEVGTPMQVAEQVADSVGVPLVELPSHRLPDEGGYRAFMTELATRIVAGLTGTA